VVSRDWIGYHLNAFKRLPFNHTIVASKLVQADPFVGDMLLLIELLWNLTGADVACGPQRGVESRGRGLT